MKTLLPSFLLAVYTLLNIANAQTTPEWVRYTSISPNGDTIAFTYKGDIYRVDANGGEATRLTFHQAHDYQPVWSHDGSSIAFASERFGNFDVFIMNAQGGQATRLTFHSSDEEPYSFNANDTEVIFKGRRMDLASHRHYPSTRHPELYSVGVNGGRIDQIFTMAAEAIDFNKQGNEFVYQDSKGADNKWRKHHTSAATKDIWRYNLGTKKHQQLTDFKGEDRNPVYASDNKVVYYLSEESGSFNVHSMNINRPNRNKQITDFELHPVRFLSLGSKNGKDILAFTYHGRPFTMVPGQPPKAVNISIRTQDNHNYFDMQNVNGEIAEMTVSPDGKEIAFIAHGDVFVASKDGAFTKQITHTAAAERFVEFDPKGKYLLYASERNSKWSIFKAEKARDVEPFFYAATLIKETPLIENSTDNYLPKISPNGEYVAYIEDRRTLKIQNLETQESTVLIERKDMIHMRDGDQDFSWSPDSQWILFTFDKLLNNSDIALVNISGSDSKQIMVPSGYYDFSPRFVNEGNQIMWFSNRDGMRNYATSARTQFDVYTQFLNQETWDKFNLNEDEFKLYEAIEEANKVEDDDKKEEDETKDNEKADTPQPLNIEWDELDDRIARLTIHSSILGDAVVNKDATKLYYLAKFEDEYDLWETDTRTKDTKKLISLGARSGSLQYNSDFSELYLLSGGSIKSLDVDAGKSKTISIKEDVEIDLNAQRQMAFEHVWLRTSKIFYEPSFHGINWQLMFDEYQPKVKDTSNGHEFTELLSEMIGELNVSHAGARYRSNIENADQTAKLGIFYDYKHEGNGVKIVEVVNGGPLDKAKFDIQPGMIIEKIDGNIISPAIDWHSLLNRKAGKFVLLDVANGNDVKQITVKPITQRQQDRLLYKRFVKINEQEVLEKSNGQLGYVHIPGMGDGPYRSIFGDIMGRFYNKKGMVIDTRFNGGGDLVADLAMFFTGESFLTYATADKVVGGEPTSRYTKPIITLFNENMYSDGHCYASGWTDLKLGKSVGMPVPGTCSFAGWESLPMGGFWGVVPVSAKNKKGEWLENNQTEPDILVKNEPGVVDFGTDQQLERAIKELLKDVK